MKKMFKNAVFGIRLSKLLMYMKLTTVFLMAGMMTVAASTYSQNTRLNLRLERATLGDFIQRIEELSEFYFFFKNSQPFL